MLKPASLAGLVLAVSVLAGCGGGDDADTGATDTETYCDQLKTDKKYLDAFSSGDADPGQLGDAIDKFHDLADAAPEEVAPDWDVLDGTLSELERSLAEAGITTEDLAGLQNGEVPKGADLAKLTKLLPKVQELNSKELQDAVASIRTHAKDACGVTLDTGAATS
jgi:outer membrane murein-binding lipoprotein Lpp